AARPCTRRRPAQGRSRGSSHLRERRQVQQGERARGNSPYRGTAGQGKGGVSGGAATAQLERIDPVGVFVDQTAGVESGEVVVQPGDAVRKLAAKVFEEILEADPGGAGGQAACGHAFEGSVHVRVAGIEGVEL